MLTKSKCILFAKIFFNKIAHSLQQNYLSQAKCFYTFCCVSYYLLNKNSTCCQLVKLQYYMCNHFLRVVRNSVFVEKNNKVFVTLQKQCCGTKFPPILFSITEKVFNFFLLLGFIMIFTFKVCLLFLTNFDKIDNCTISLITITS